VDWLKNNYDRVALALAAAVLFASGTGIFYRALNFNEELSAAATRSLQRPAGPPGKAGELGAAAQLLRQAPQWTFRGRSGLFVPEKHFIGPDGQPATLQTTEVHPPVPNEWFEQFGLSVADADALDQDPDDDGFSNLDEWQGHTNPVDPKSHPDYRTKLKLKSVHEESFPLIFASRTEDVFGINNTDRSKPTQFLRVGDKIAGYNFRIASFKEKYARDKYGTNVDVSELSLENLDTAERITLTKEQVATSPESVATFIYTWKERRELVVKKDQEFSLPPETDIRYKLIDVQPTKAVIASSLRPDAPVEIRLLSP
jgi:hypothetical protein